MMTRTTKGLALGLALALAWALFLATSGRVVGVGDLKPPTLQTLTVTASTDFQWVLQDINGNPVKLSDFKGQPILLNIWATWCGPCLMEMPSLAKLAENPRVKAKGVVILCVATDESQATLQEFVKDKPWKMTILRATSLPPAFETDTIPATFLIAPNGQIVCTEAGAAQWDDPTVIEFLEKIK
jgi:thiol-disulfide isomerase/thioredoxin